LEWVRKVEKKETQHLLFGVCEEESNTQMIDEGEITAREQEFTMPGENVELTAYFVSGDELYEWWLRWRGFDR